MDKNKQQICNEEPKDMTVKDVELTIDGANLTKGEAREIAFKIERLQEMIRKNQERKHGI